MGFEVVHDSHQGIWAPVINTDTLYVGQIVQAANEGVSPLTTAVGVGDTTGKEVPFGVVIGTNKRTPSFNTTYKAESITYASPAAAAAEDYALHEGPWARGDLQAMVKIIPITAQTVLKAPLFTDSFGTAPTVGTLSGTPDTVSATSGAVEEAGVASLSTLFVRSGGAAGSIRVTDDTSTTALTWDLPLVVAPVAGDTVVRVNLRPQGLSRMQVDSECMYVDTGATVTTNYFLIDVIRLDLRTAGKEYVEFRFHPCHFDSVRT